MPSITQPTPHSPTVYYGPAGCCYTEAITLTDDMDLADYFPNAVRQPDLSASTPITTCPDSAPQPDAQLLAQPDPAPVAPSSAPITDPLPTSPIPTAEPSVPNALPLTTDQSTTPPFGTQLRAARLQCGLATLRQCSDALASVGIHRSAASLGNWERDRNRPPNRAQLLPLLSLLAQRGGFASPAASSPTPSPDLLTAINDLLWLLDWRNLNLAEIAAYFSFSSTIPSHNTQQITKPTNEIINDPVPTSQLDHATDHLPTSALPITPSTPLLSTISSTDRSTHQEHTLPMPSSSTPPLSLLSTKHSGLSTSSPSPAVSP